MLALGALAFWSFAACGSKAHPHPPRAYDIRPEARIPVGPLGYLPPGEIPSFYFHAAVSLHFIDANHLLFAFDIKGLLRRDDKCASSDSQRMVKAVVLDIPSGRVEKQVDWELYDFSDFLWGIGGGQFLLRRCSTFYLVGANLVPQPLIEGEGAVEGVMFSPDHSMAVVETRLKTARSSSRSAEFDDSEDRSARKFDAAFLRLRPLGVISHALLPIPGVLPIVDQGILEVLTARHNRWILDLQLFRGAQRQIVTIHSFCMPDLRAIADRVVVAGMCPAKGEKVFEAYDLNGKTLWKIPFVADRHDPRFLLTENGARFAIESLHATQPLAALDPLNRADIDDELIDIYDTRTGIQIGSFATTPVYTAGKNVDFSPDGLRIAVLHNGAIEIYSLNELAKNRTGPH